ncbi:hypothetical protein BC828DRAFT_373190 [Blastocladiella britannica]|nr:hypothetical protein BC828DRAFT_373190 [Blastocladiella britannica]
MKLTVKTLAQKAIVLDVEPTTTVGDLKQMLSASQGFDVASQKLIYSGKILIDAQTVDELKVKEQDFMVVMVAKAKPTSTAASSAAAPAPAPVPATPAPASAAAPAVAPAAPAPAAAPAHPAPTPATPTPAAPADPSFAMGSAFNAAVENMIEMGYPREQVVAAMRAAYNNPDRAFEYLMTGIPAHLQQQQQQQAPPAATPAAPAAVPTPAAPAVAPVADPANLFNLAQQQAAATTTGGGAPGSQAGLEGLAQLASGEQFAQIRAMLQANPALLEPILQQMVASNPGLAPIINANPQLFLQMLMGGGAGGAGGAGGDDDEEFDEMDDQGNPIPPGATAIHVTEDEKAAIDRLCALGFDRNSVIQAYLACDKNEELAANFLFENQFD